MLTKMLRAVSTFVAKYSNFLFANHTFLFLFLYLLFVCYQLLLFKSGQGNICFLFALFFSDLRANRFLVLFLTKNLCLFFDKVYFSLFFINRLVFRILETFGTHVIKYGVSEHIFANNAKFRNELLILVCGHLDVKLWEKRNSFVNIL